MIIMQGTSKTGPGTFNRFPVFSRAVLYYITCHEQLRDGITDIKLIIFYLSLRLCVFLTPSTGVGICQVL